MVDEKKIDANFFQLVVSLQMAAMQSMGKIASPVSGQVERNLEQARASIDMLEMISEKTENNLTEEEKSLLDRVLYELRMNFVDESKKGDTEDETSVKSEASEKGDTKKEQPAENDKEADKGEEK